MLRIGVESIAPGPGALEVFLPVENAIETR